MRECSDVRASEVMGPDVSGERINARNGLTSERVGRVVISADHQYSHGESDYR